MKGSYLCPWLVTVVFGSLAMTAFIGYPQESNAAVYRCLSKQGIEFRAMPCDPDQQPAGFVNLPVIKKGLPPKKQARQEKQAEKAFAQSIKKGETQRKRRVTTRAKQWQKEQRAEKRAKRLAVRCEELLERIERIQSQLRAGCKLRRCMRLQIQLEQCRARQRRQCPS